MSTSRIIRMQKDSSKLKQTGTLRCRSPLIPRVARRGLTLIEISAAVVLLLIAVGLAVEVMVSSASAEQAAQQRTLALEMLSSLLEEKMALPPAELTPAEAANWPMPAEARDLLPAAKLEAEVKNIAGPPAGKQVTLKLTWQDAALERTKPLILSAWVYPRVPEEAEP